MLALSQLKSQNRQLLLFRNIVPFPRLLAGCASFPFEYFGRSGKASLPWAINLLITSRCNLHCEMCHIDRSKFCLKDEELGLNDIKAFIKDVSKSKAHIFLGGGEPFLREDIFEIIRFIKNYGLTCGICTNGTLLDENKIKELVDLEPLFIIFSLQGTRDIHDKVTGVPGSYDILFKNIKTIASLKKRPRLIINCAITNSNLHHLKEIVEIAQLLKVDMFRFENLNFLTDSEAMAHYRVWRQDFQEKDDMRLSSYITNISNYEDYCNSIKAIEKVKNGFKMPIYVKPYLDDSELRSWYSDNFKTRRKCFFLWRSLFISPNGDILPCQFLVYKLGNIKTDSLGEIWNSKRYRDLRLRLKRGLFPGCSRCCKL
ncbi:radical SAM/SPASM domain-containing protein [Candidatus Omnitrophota bacterium]